MFKVAKSLNNNLIKPDLQIRFNHKNECREIAALSKMFEAESCCNGIVADKEDYFFDKKVAVCVYNNQIIGYAYGEMDTEDKNRSYAKVGDKYFYLDEIYIAKQYRRMCVGEKLYKFLEDYAISQGAKTIRVSAVSKDYNKILNFYINKLGLTFWSAFLVKPL